MDLSPHFTLKPGAIAKPTHYEQKCVQAIVILVASTSSYDMSVRGRDITLSQCMNFRVTDEDHVSLDAIHSLYF